MILLTKLVSDELVKRFNLMTIQVKLKLIEEVLRWIRLMSRNGGSETLLGETKVSSQLRSFRWSDRVGKFE